MGCNPPGSSVRGILQEKMLKQVFLLQDIFPIQGLNLHLLHWRFSLIAQLVKNLPATQETLFQFLGQKDPLDKG